MTIKVSGENLELLPQKAVFWSAFQTLLIADLHLGKIAHFRKSGIPVPVRAARESLESLVALVTLTNPSRVIFLGDLFHSHYNSDWEEFGALIRHFPAISFDLVIGNHDILSAHQYFRAKISLHEELIAGPFVFTHEPKMDCRAYNLAGHIHPGVSLRGKGRQSVTLPCFYFGAERGVLPSFGVFTGLAKITPKKEDQVFVVAENTIMQVN